MAKNVPEVIIVMIILTTFCLLYLINKSLNNLNFIRNPEKEYSWLVHGIINIIGYSSVFLPGYLVYKYVRKINYLNKSGNKLFQIIVSKCFGDIEELPLSSSSSSTTNVVINEDRSQIEECLLLLFYFTGLLVSYLSWGVLQEKVMTQSYVNVNGDVGYFKDTQFLVFVNRILAFGLTGIILICRRQPRHKCPLYKYIYCSFSNIMSSWCQYEALKYVSFPHQVLAKAAKTIPVMIMGKIVSRTKYEYYEYVTAVILSIGMLFFMLDTENNPKSTITTLSGVLLLISYIAFDSFTSNWQGKLFKTYHIKPIQMMCSVNFFSCIFTTVSILQQNGFSQSIDFMLNYPRFSLDCILLSLFSATGQLFIYSTLSVFGPLIFAIITTVRQGFSVFLSCIIYHHRINSLGIFGIILVFISILLRLYCGHRLKTIKRKTLATNRSQKL